MSSLIQWFRSLFYVMSSSISAVFWRLTDEVSLCVDGGCRTDLPTSRGPSGGTRVFTYIPSSQCYSLRIGTEWNKSHSRYFVGVTDSRTQLNWFVVNTLEPILDVRLVNYRLWTSELPVCLETYLEPRKGSRHFGPCLLTTDGSESWEWTFNFIMIVMSKQYS